MDKAKPTEPVEKIESKYHDLLSSKLKIVSENQQTDLTDSLVEELSGIVDLSDSNIQAEYLDYLSKRYK